MDLHIIDPDSQQQLISTTPSLMSLAGLSREDQHELDEERFREIGISDPPLDGLAIEIPDEDDGFMVAENDDDEYKEDIKETPELMIERYDDDYVLDSDTDEKLEPTESVDGSDADKEDNGGESGEGPYAGEEDQEEIYEYSDTTRSETAVDIRENLKAFLQENKAPMSATSPPKVTIYAAKLERPLTPYNHSYSSDEEEIQNPSMLHFDTDSEPSPKRNTSGYLNRPLPTLPFLPRESALRKSSLHDHRSSLSDISQAQSNSSSPEVSPSISVRAEAGSPLNIISIGQLVKHSGNAKLVLTPPQNKRESSDSKGTARSDSPATASPDPTSKVGTLLVTALNQTPPSKSHVDDSAHYLTPEEQHPIGIAISPPSPYANHNNDGTTGHFTPLPPHTFFNRRTTDPQKKTPRVPSSDPEPACGATLSPISEYNTPMSTPETHKQKPDSPIDCHNSPTTQSIRDRRFALVNKAPSRLSIIIPTVEMALEKERSDAEGKCQKPEMEEVDVEVDVQVEGYDASRQPRRRPKYDNLKEAPLQKKEEEGETLKENVFEGELLPGETE